MSLSSSVHIKAGFKNQKTFLKESYCTSPYKVANVTEDRTSSLLRLMMMSSSPGVLNNDQYIIQIDIEKEASLWLTTQGYQRIFTMKGSARQSVTVNVEDSASFIYLPHPNVPHKEANFTADNTIHLARNHRLIWSEITTCGRKLSGEEFLFTRYKNTTNVFIAGKLVVKENLLLEPFKRNIHAIGQLENYSHQSSFLLVDSCIDIAQVAEECQQLLSLAEGISFGISKLSVNGLSIRMLGYKGEQLYNLHNALAQVMIQVSKKTEDAIL